MRDCVGWEGRVSLCDHRSSNRTEMLDIAKIATLQGNKVVVCTDASHNIGPNNSSRPHSTPPTMAFRTSDNSFVILHMKTKVLVFRFKSNEPVTQDMLRAGLKTQDTSLDGVLCPHVTAGD